MTIHVGEEGGDMGREETAEVVEHLRPERIGHGILAAGDPELMRTLRDLGIVLEICPTSNLLTKALPDEEAVRETIRRFVEHGVAFTIATDGPEMMRTHLRDELELLRRIGALDEEELREANARGHAAAFRRKTAVPGVAGRSARTASSQPSRAGARAPRPARRSECARVARPRPRAREEPAHVPATDPDGSASRRSWSVRSSPMPMTKCDDSFPFGNTSRTYTPLSTPRARTSITRWPWRISAGAPARCCPRSFRSSCARQDPYSGSASR